MAEESDTPRRRYLRMSLRCTSYPSSFGRVSIDTRANPTGVDQVRRLRNAFTHAIGEAWRVPSLDYLLEKPQVRDIVSNRDVIDVCMAAQDVPTLMVRVLREHEQSLTPYDLQHGVILFSLQPW